MLSPLRTVPPQDHMASLPYTIKNSPHKSPLDWFSFLIHTWWRIPGGNASGKYVPHSQTKQGPHASLKLYANFGH